MLFINTLHDLELQAGCPGLLMSVFDLPSTPHDPTRTLPFLSYFTNFMYLLEGILGKETLRAKAKVRPSASPGYMQPF